MTHVLVIGAAGMLGRKLVEKLTATGRIAGQDITRMTLADVVAPAAPEGIAIPVSCVAADLSDPGVATELVAHRPGHIFHLAAIVSGEAEVEFDKGYRINMHGTLALLEAVRQADYCPRIVYASSIAVFGAPFPDAIPDTFHTTPLTSYGAQKAIGELLLADYTRKGFCDGIGIRLPTIVVRPGKPNKAASGFFSGIIREPLDGNVAILPVQMSVKHWMASPRAAVGFLEHAAGLDGAALGARRTLTMPGLAVTVGEEIDALREIAGQEHVDLIRFQPDEAIARIVAGWPRAFDAARATELGFVADESFLAIVRAYIEDERIRI
ncbi:D-erythronate dehydrogenase [Breoghania sp. L-A4]|uniref:D-erythronate dehydrogenase n=1 Tax=Breoghania sp. L-A4 TaxID=2304600 RepID=UPI000E359C78|nr:D-erythronate dehydrogenase [Breoghania sp. L-A4]AXS41947.1 NAD-dependent epimerase/dehydratase family protein [Breoghania sp. L-A4]